MGFLACGGFSVLLQIGLVLALLFAFEDLTKKIVDPKENPAKYDQGGVRSYARCSLPCHAELARNA